MISKSRFSLIAVIMLVLLGFGIQDQAKGQPGENAQFCPFVEVPIGWLKTEDITPITAINFSGALIGTVEAVNGAAVGGMDWQHVDFTDLDAPTPTNEVGAQAVTWWTQADGRTTFVQVTNAEQFFDTAVHVRILDENCNEIRNFCDFYSGGDTHVYDLGDLVTNEGGTPDDNVLQGHEGFLTITAVDECPSPDLAFAHNALAVTVQVVDDDDYSYGFNANHRFAVCDEAEIITFENLVLNGSFQDGQLGPWSIEQGASENAGVITSSGISPSIPVPPCQGPDCDDPDADLYMAFVASDGSFPSGYYGQNSSPTSILGWLNDPDFTNSGTNDTNVTVLQSNQFTPFSTPNAVANTQVVDFDLRFLAANDLLFTCGNYVAVCVIDITSWLANSTLNSPSFTDCVCYNRDGSGECSEVGDDNFSYTIGTHEFQGGSSALINGELTGLSSGQTYVVQVITGQKVNDGCSSAIFPRGDTGGLVDNVRNVETIRTFESCDGTLDGSEIAYLTNFLPSQFAGQFNKIDDNEAGGDAIMINFADEYLPNYRTIGAFVTAEVGIVDVFEEFQSCGDVTACYLRLGIDDSIGISDDFSSPTPTTGPTTPPTSTPPVTPSPTPTNTGGGGGGSCAIAGAPVQLGTAFANVLIPLVPVAFAFGVRAARRRRNK